MGEIVRVLKWRLDVDAEGMASGIDKAATSAERLQKATAEVGEKGAVGLKKVADAAKETDVAFEGMGLEAKQVEMYLGRLEKGAGSPLVLQRNAELAQAALSVLASKAEAAGTALDTAFTGRVEAAIAGAKEQAAGMNAELEKMGGQTPTKLDKVITALEKTEASAAGAWSAIEKMGQEGAAAAAALAKLEKAADSPRELARAAALADLEMQNLRVAIDKARASGAQLGPGLGQAMDAAATKIETANVRAAKLRDTMGDMKTKGDQAAKGFEAAAGSAGSLEGMLGRLIDTGGKTEQMFAKVGFGVLAVGTAFEFGWDKGTKFNGFIREHGNYLEKLIELQQRQIDGLGSWNDLLSALPIKMNPVIKAHQAHEKAARESADAVSKLGISFSTMGGATTKFTAEAKALDAALVNAQRNGEKWDDLLKLNGASIKALLAEAARLGIAVDKLPPSLQKAADGFRVVTPAVDELAVALGGLATALSASTADTAAKLDAVGKALADIKATGGDVGTAVGANTAAFVALRTEAERSYETLDKFRKEVMDQIPAYQASAIAAQQYANAFAELDKMTAATTEYEAARRAANEADLAAGAQLAALQAEAAGAARAIDTIGEAWFKATGQAAGFTVEVRHQTQAVQEVSPEFESFIESLAGVSDQYERMTPYVGALIAQLEKGEISTAEFEKTINSLRVAFMQIQGVSGQMFGDIDTLFNKLTKLTNDFVAGDRGRKR